MTRLLLLYICACLQVTTANFQPCQKAYTNSADPDQTAS